MPSQPHQPKVNRAWMLIVSNMTEEAATDDDERRPLISPPSTKGRGPCHDCWAWIFGSPPVRGMVVDLFHLDRENCEQLLKHDGSDHIFFWQSVIVLDSLLGCLVD